MLFNYEEGCNGHKLSFKTDNHIDVVVYFDENHNLEFILMDEMYEFLPTEDQIRGVFIKYKGEFYSIWQVFDNARNQIDGVVLEVEEDNFNESLHAAYLSSPYMTGRV